VTFEGHFIGKAWGASDLSWLAELLIFLSFGHVKGCKGEGGMGKVGGAGFSSGRLDKSFDEREISPERVETKYFFLLRNLLESPAA
jgi:hypothetical protein